MEKQIASTTARLERLTIQQSDLSRTLDIEVDFKAQSQQVRDLQRQLDELNSRTDLLDKNQVQLEQKITAPRTNAGRGKVGIFIDGSNLFYALNKLNIRIDYIKLLKLLVGEDNLFRATYYTGINSNSDREYGFINWLHHNGYRVVTKEVVKRVDGSKKANLDVEIALDIVELSSQYDTIVLVGGDGDFAYALEKVSSQGCRIEVVSLRSSTSDALINIADSYTDLQTLAPKIRK